jgi:D-alanine-D-alanine ligase
MKIGLTYDLREDYLKLGYDEQQVAEFDSPETIAAIGSALRGLGHTTARIGRVRNLIARLERGERWDLVWNIAEGLSATGIGREAQAPAILDLYGVPYTFADPMVCSLTLHKAMTKRVVRDLGIPTPRFALVEDEAGIAAVDLPFPLFAKPIAEGSSKGVTGASRITGVAGLRAVCADLLARYRQPVLVETYLPGREFTVGLLGTGERARAIAALEVNLLPGGDDGVYSYGNKENWRRVVRYSLADGPIAADACALALKAWRGLGGRDGGRVDIRAAADGTLNFIEVNVLPGLKPGHSDLPILAELAGIAYPELIARILASAMERVTAPPPPPAGGGSRLREVKPRRRAARAKAGPGPAAPARRRTARTVAKARTVPKNRRR